jgi:hypothetical protein
MLEKRATDLKQLLGSNPGLVKEVHEKNIENIE